MKNFFLKISACTILLFGAQNIYAQPGNSNLPDTNQVYTTPDQVPEFPGGEIALFGFLRENIHYPEYEKESLIEGTVWAGFTVGKDGKVNDVRILKTVAGSKYLDAEVIRVISIMPAWKPGMMNGRAIKCDYKLPVKFNLTDNKTSSDSTHANEINVTLKPKPPLQAITVTDPVASFKGGDVALMKFLTKNVRYPEEAKRDSISGKLIMKVIVAADGSLEKIEAIQFPPNGQSLVDETIRVIKLTEGSWIPAKQNGTPLRSSMMFPVAFKLD